MFIQPGDTYESSGNIFAERDIQTTSFYGQDQFKERFGTVDNGVLEISAKWQTAIQQSMAVGELIGLAITGLLADTLGWRPILSGMMIVLTGSLFLFAFADSLGMLVAAMVMCGKCTYSVLGSIYVFVPYFDINFGAYI